MEKHSPKNTAVTRRLIATVAAAMFAVLFSGIAFAMMRSRIANMHIIFYLILGISLLVVIYLSLWTLSASEKHLRLSKILRRCYMISLAVGLALFLTLQGLIISGARTDDAKADYLIILGAGLRNGAPSLILRSRLDAAIVYLETHGEMPVIVSGGLGVGESITEAEAMFRYLRTRGIDESLIWLEGESTSTKENLQFSLELIEEMGFDVDGITVAIVSSEFHLYRAKLIAGKVGFVAFGVAAETPGFHLRALNSFREAFALGSEFLFG